MDEHDVIGRLRSLAGRPLDDRTAADHLSRAASVGPRRPRPVRLAAVVVATLLAIPAAAFAVSAAGDGTPPAMVAGDGDPAQDGGPGGTDADRPDGPPPGTNCAGPPPFADQPAQPADPSAGVIPSPRAHEANALDAARAACPDDPGGRPEGTPSGPPEGTPSGPPAGVESGAPEGTPSGPPAGVESGAPEGTPTGPPTGTRSGPPTGEPGAG
jgi:hypothetical protein